MTVDWTITNEHQFNLLRLYQQSGVYVNITTVSTVLVLLPSQAAGAEIPEGFRTQNGIGMRLGLTHNRNHGMRLVLTTGIA